MNDSYYLPLLICSCPHWFLTSDIRARDILCTCWTFVIREQWYQVGCPLTMLSWMYPGSATKQTETAQSIGSLLSHGRNSLVTSVSSKCMNIGLVHVRLTIFQLWECDFPAHGSSCYSAGSTKHKLFKQKSLCSAYTSVIECSLFQGDEHDCDVMQFRGGSRNVEGRGLIAWVFMCMERSDGAHADAG